MIRLIADILEHTAMGNANDRKKNCEDPSSDMLSRWQESDDRAALDELLAVEITRLKTRIRSQARYMTDATASASDVAQEAVFRLLNNEARPQFDNPQALRAYLWTTAWRLLADRLRSAGRAVTELDATQSGALGSEFATTGGLDSVEDRDQSVVLELTVNLLEPDDQEILSLVHFRGRGLDGAAQELGISRAAANVRWMRARRSLARKLLRWTEVIG